MIQYAVLIMIEPITLGCVVRESLTIKAVHSASRFFSINGDADLLQKEITFLGDRGGFSMPASILLLWKLVRVENEERGKGKYGV